MRVASGRAGVCYNRHKAKPGQKGMDVQHSRDVRRLGVFGGSFDPIHLGHLIAAECVRDALGLDLVLFVPAHRSPLKEEVEAAPQHRLEMVRLAVAGHPCFAVSTVDIDRPPPSYTVETLGLLRREYADATLYLIIGYDSYREFHRWRQPETIVRLAELVVVKRPPVPLEGAAPEAREAAGPPPARWQQEARVHFVDIPLIGISATDLRRRVSEGRTITFQVPAAVEHYIKRHGLYRAAPSDVALKGGHLDGAEGAACGGSEGGNAPAR
jgi:nicotinate-nucleotide adenylyltransferase